MEGDEVSERTSVTLPASLAHRLTYEARRTRRSVSAVVRDALTEYLSKGGPVELPAFVGIGRSGHADTAERAEEILAEIVDERFPMIMGRDEAPE
jgi:metal-responsive CopG/Arc/MetJ family transcriptional regulator